LLRDVGIDEERLASVVLFILAITLHNMPEGLAVSVAAVNAGLDRRFYAVVTGIRSGLVEIPLVLLGALAVSVAEPVVSLWVVSRRLPGPGAGGRDSRRTGNRRV